MFNSLQSHGPQPSRLFCPWDSPARMNTGMGCHFILQGTKLTDAPKHTTWCPVQDSRLNFTHQSSGTTTSHQEVDMGPWTNLTHQGADDRIKRNDNPAGCERETTNTVSLVQTLSRVQLCATMDCSPPGSSVLGFSRQEYRNGLPFPFPEDIPDPGIKPGSPTL